MSEQIDWPPGTPVHLTVPVWEMGYCHGCADVVRLADHVCPGEEREGEE
ncbi:hypothetical protein [Streptomyces sp. NBC_01803]|nr:hypothetical protein [Streptomyces sp. NBC_01803]WSA43726.1 hypothetical protein OIE51_05630 [Streptomyces sp. NBC_01803]